MADKGIITLEEAQTAAEKFLGGQVKNLKKTTITKVKLSSVGGITIYEVEGIMELPRCVFWTRPFNFKVQINARDGAAVGYETTG